MALAMFVVPVVFLVLVPWRQPTWETGLAVLFIVAFAGSGSTFAWMGLMHAKQALFDARARVLRRHPSRHPSAPQRPDRRARRPRQTWRRCRRREFVEANEQT